MQSCSCLPLSDVVCVQLQEDVHLTPVKHLTVWRKGCLCSECCSSKRTFWNEDCTLRAVHFGGAAIGDGSWEEIVGTEGQMHVWLSSWRLLLNVGGNKNIFLPYWHFRRDWRSWKCPNILLWDVFILLWMSAVPLQKFDSEVNELLIALACSATRENVRSCSFQSLSHWTNEMWPLFLRA